VAVVVNQDGVVVACDRGDDQVGDGLAVQPGGEQVLLQVDRGDEDGVVGLEPDALLVQIGLEPRVVSLVAGGVQDLQFDDGAGGQYAGDGEGFEDPTCIRVPAGQLALH
jgi:hypothetical protein